MPHADATSAASEVSAYSFGRRVSEPPPSRAEALDGAQPRPAVSPIQDHGVSGSIQSTQRKSSSIFVSNQESASPPLGLEKVVINLPAQRCETRNIQDIRTPSSQTLASKPYFGVVLRPASFSGTPSKRLGDREKTSGSASMSPSTKSSPQASNGQTRISAVIDPCDNDKRIHGQTTSTENQNGFSEMVKSKDNRDMSHGVKKSMASNAAVEIPSINHQDTQQHLHHQVSQNPHKLQQKHQEQPQLDLCERTSRDIEGKKPRYLRRHESLPYDQSVLRVRGSWSGNTNVPSFIEARHLFSAGNHAAVPSIHQRKSSNPDTQPIRVNVRHLVRKMSDPNSVTDRPPLVSCVPGAANIHRRQTPPDAGFPLGHITAQPSPSSQQLASECHGEKICPKWRKGIDLLNAGIYYTNPIGNKTDSAFQTSDAHSDKNSFEQARASELFSSSDSPWRSDSHTDEAFDGRATNSPSAMASQTLGGDDFHHEPGTRDEKSGEQLCSIDDNIPEDIVAAAQMVIESPTFETERVETVKQSGDISEESKGDSIVCNGVQQTSTLNTNIAVVDLAQPLTAVAPNRSQTETTAESNHLSAKTQEHRIEISLKLNQLESTCESNQKANECKEKRKPKESNSSTNLNGDDATARRNQSSKLNHHNAVLESDEVNTTRGSEYSKTNPESQVSCAAAEPDHQDASTRSYDSSPTAQGSQQPVCRTLSGQERRNTVASLVSKFSSGISTSNAPRIMHSTGIRQHNHHHRLSLPTPSLHPEDCKRSPRSEPRLGRSTSLRGDDSGQGRGQNEMIMEQAEIDRLLLKSQEMRRSKQRQLGNHRADTEAINNTATACIVTSENCSIIPDYVSAANVLSNHDDVKTNQALNEPIPQTVYGTHQSPAESASGNEIVDAAVSSVSSSSPQSVYEDCRSSSTTNTVNYLTASLENDHSSNTDSHDCMSSRVEHLMDTYSRSKKSRRTTITASRESGKPSKITTKTAATLSTIQTPGDLLLAATVGPLAKPPPAPIGRKSKAVTENSKNNIVEPKLLKSKDSKKYPSKANISDTKGDGPRTHPSLDEKEKPFVSNPNTLTFIAGNQIQRNGSEISSATQLAQLKDVPGVVTEPGLSSDLRCANKQFNIDEDEFDHVFIEDNGEECSRSPTQGATVRLKKSSSSHVFSDYLCKKGGQDLLRANCRSSSQCISSSSSCDQAGEWLDPGESPTSCQNNMRLSQAERIARYKENRRRQLAYVSEKIGLELTAAPGLRSVRSRSSNRVLRRSQSDSDNSFHRKEDALYSSIERAKTVANQGRPTSTSCYTRHSSETSNISSCGESLGKSSDVTEMAKPEGSSKKKKKGTSSEHDCVFKRLSSAVKKSPRCKKAGCGKRSQENNEASNTTQHELSMDSNDILTTDATEKSSVLHSSFTAANRRGRAYPSNFKGLGPLEVSENTRGVTKLLKQKVSEARDVQGIKAVAQAFNSSKKDTESNTSIVRHVSGATISPPNTSPRASKPDMVKDLGREKHNTRNNHSPRDTIKSPKELSPRNLKCITSRPSGVAYEHIQNQSERSRTTSYLSLGAETSPESEVSTQTKNDHNLPYNAQGKFSGISFTKNNLEKNPAASRPRPASVKEKKSWPENFVLPRRKSASVSSSKSNTSEVKLVQQLSPSAQSLKEKIVSNLTSKKAHTARHTPGDFSKDCAMEADKIRQEKVTSQVESKTAVMSFTRQHLSKCRKSSWDFQGGLNSVNGSACDRLKSKVFQRNKNLPEHSENLSTRTTTGNVQTGATTEKYEVFKHHEVKENCRQYEKRPSVGSTSSNGQILPGDERRHSLPVYKRSVKAAADTVISGVSDHGSRGVRFQAHRASLVSRPVWNGSASRVERLQTLKREQDETLARFKQFMNRQERAGNVREITQVTEEHTTHVQECCIRVSSMEEAERVAMTLMESVRHERSAQQCVQEITSAYPGCNQRQLFVKEPDQKVPEMIPENTRTRDKDLGDLYVNVTSGTFYDALDTGSASYISAGYRQQSTSSCVGKPDRPQPAPELTGQVSKNTSSEAIPKISSSQNAREVSDQLKVYVPTKEEEAQVELSGSDVGDTSTSYSSALSQIDESRKQGRQDISEQNLKTDHEVSCVIVSDTSDPNRFEQNSKTGENNTKNIASLGEKYTPSPSSSNEGNLCGAAEFCRQNGSESNPPINAAIGQHVVQTMSPRPVVPVMILPDQAVRSEPQPVIKSGDFAICQISEQDGKRMLHQDKDIASGETRECVFPVEICGKTQTCIKQYKIGEDGNLISFEEDNHGAKSSSLVEQKMLFDADRNVPCSFNEVLNGAFNSKSEVCRVITPATSMTASSTATISSQTTVYSGPYTIYSSGGLTESESFCGQSLTADVSTGSTECGKGASLVTTRSLKNSNVSKDVGETLCRVHRNNCKDRETIAVSSTCAEKETLACREDRKSCSCDRMEESTFQVPASSESRDEIFRKPPQLEVNRSVHVSKALLNVAASGHETPEIIRGEGEQTSFPTHERANTDHLDAMRLSEKHEHVINVDGREQSSDALTLFSNVENGARIEIRQTEVVEKQFSEAEKKSSCSLDGDHINVRADKPSIDKSQHLQEFLGVERFNLCSANIENKPADKLTCTEEGSAPIKATTDCDELEREDKPCALMGSECHSSKHRPPTDELCLTRRDFDSKDTSSVGYLHSKIKPCDLPDTGCQFDKSAQPVALHHTETSTQFSNNMAMKMVGFSNPHSLNGLAPDDGGKEVKSNDAQCFEDAAPSLPGSSTLAQRVKAYLTSVTNTNGEQNQPHERKASLKDLVVIRSTTFIKHEKEGREAANSSTGVEREGAQQETTERQVVDDQKTNVMGSHALQDTCLDTNVKFMAAQTVSADVHDTAAVKQDSTTSRILHNEGDLKTKLAGDNMEENSTISNRCQPRTATFVIKNVCGVEELPDNTKDCEMNSRALGRNQPVLGFTDDKCVNDREKVKEESLPLCEKHGFHKDKTSPLNETCPSFIIESAFEESSSKHLTRSDLLETPEQFDEEQSSETKPSECPRQSQHTWFTSAKSSLDFSSRQIAENKAVQELKPDHKSLKDLSLNVCPSPAKPTENSLLETTSPEQYSKSPVTKVQEAPLSARSSHSKKTKSELDLDYLINHLDLSSDSFDALFLQNAMYLRGTVATMPAPKTNKGASAANSAPRYTTLTLKRRRSASGALSGQFSIQGPLLQVKRRSVLEKSRANTSRRLEELTGSSEKVRR